MESPGPGSPWRLPVLLALVQLTNPNIPKAHRVTVILQTQWQLVRRWLVGRALVVRGRTRQFHVVLYEHFRSESKYSESAPGYRDPADSVAACPALACREGARGAR